MPYSIVHTELAFETRNILALEEKDFDSYLVGSIFVDSNYLLKENGHNIKRRVTHYYGESEYESTDFPEVFWEQEGSKSPFILGYYFHLLTDKVWRDSSSVAKAYQSEELERWYQISRKIHSYYDLQKLLENTEKTNIIEKSLAYDFDTNLIPKVFHGVPKSTLKSTYKRMVDFMLGKDIFVKKSEKKDDYRIVDGVLHINDSNLEKKVLEMFPYEEYEFLKKMALDEFQSKVLSKIS